MNFEYFIVKRIIKKSNSKGSISSPIIKIGVLAIALGLSMMMISVSTGTGLQKEIKDKLVTFSGHIQISYYENIASEISDKPVAISQNTLNQIMALPHVSAIIPIISRGAVMRTDVDFEGVLVKGTVPEYYPKYLKKYMISGQFPDFDSAKISKQLLISEHLSDRLRLHLGDTVQLLFLKNHRKIPHQRYLTVAGIYNSGFEEFDATNIFIDQRHLQHINKWRDHQVSFYNIYLDDFDQASAVNKEIYNKTPFDIDTKTVIHRYESVIKWLNMLDYNIYIIIAIMIIVGGVNMITVMLVLVLERTSMIGVLKSLGSTNGNIRKIFIYKASYLIIVGLILGNVIGLVLLYFQQKIGVISLDPNTYYVNTVPVNINAIHFLFLNLGTFVLCVLMLLLPSYIVSKISPVKAMKYS